MTNRSLSASRLAAPAIALALAGCAAGPDFRRPPDPEARSFTAEPVSARTASAPTPQGEAQRLVPGLPTDARWWRELKSPRLDALIESALDANPSLAAARATLRQARELQAAQAASARLPQVEATLGAQHQRTNPGTLGLPGDPREFDLYNAGVAVRYDLDLAGGNRRVLEALAARADYRSHELDAARLMLAGNIATAAIARARLAAQFEATAALLGEQVELVQVAGERLRLGQAAPEEVLGLQVQAAQTRAELPALLKQLRHAEHLLATLAGRTPDARGVPDFTLEEFSLPAELPVTVPSELLRRRPDIRASEALLRAANADYGAAVARLYPAVSLSASAGSQALTAAALFGGGTAVGGLVAQLVQPLFRPGLAAEKRAALAAFDAAVANHQAVVLDAFRGVADSLRAVESDAQALAALAAAAVAAGGSANAVEQRYRLGASSHVEVLVARQQARRTRLALVAARAQRLADSVALYQAIGAGMEPQQADTGGEAADGST
ncbi:MAG: efflux transporter outer membrane subunit [Burkholderiales bacterium]|nr:efflux transporter outer membrane subunit [Burkholderiales bacterium]